MGCKCGPSTLPNLIAQSVHTHQKDGIRDLQNVFTGIESTVEQAHDLLNARSIGEQA